jgi:hypothetical protein
LPYKSKAEQKAELWMTLPQAIAHICAADCINERSARRELLKALADDAFRTRHRHLVQWQDEVRISGEATPDQIGPPDVPPRGQEWAQAKMRWASGKVLDPFGAVVNGQWRPAWRTVLLYRSKVIELWPPSPPAKTRTASASRENFHRFKRTPGPKPKKGVAVIEAIKADLKAQRLTIKTLRTMPDKQLEKYGQVIKAQRTTCREARNAVLAEFDGNTNTVD